MTVLVVLALAGTADALPLPFPTRTATPVRTPTPTATPATWPDMAPEISDVSLSLGATVAAGDVAEGCAEAASGVDLLRFSVLSRNVGTADLRLGDPRCPSPCADHPLEVCGNPDFVCSPAAGHNHPHYENYARYELRDTQDEVVVVGHKQGFCLRDTACGAPVYTCAFQGISVGCSDLYHASLGCQYLDVTGIPSGSYVLRVTIDPLDLIPELTNANNTVQLNVTITRPGQPTATRTRTPTPTRTPTATRTSTPQSTPTPTQLATTTAMLTPTDVPTPTATPSVTATPAVTATSHPSPTPTADGAVDAAAAPACQRALLGAGRTLLARTIAILDGCTSAVAACESPRRRTPACQTRARAACADAAEALDAAAAVFTSRVTGRCAALGDAGLRLASGLGFARNAAECAARFGTTTDALPAIATCVARQHLCRASALVATEDPRTGARLVRGEALGMELCVADVGGADPEAPELAESRALESCSRAIRRGARTFARRRLASLQRCVAADAVCLAVPAGAAACRERAATTCASRLARLEADGARLAATIERGCGALDFALVRSALGLNLGATACAAYGVPALDSLGDYVRCLTLRHACATDDLLRFEAPRADEWIGTWPAPAGACPAEPD